MLDRLAPNEGSKKSPKRVGRGPGSGIGKTAGRGVKGQGKRSAGRETPAWFEGGQMPLARRLPKRGFYSRNRKDVQAVNVGALSVLGDGAEVNPESLAARGLVRSAKGIVKLLGEGEVPANLRVRVHRLSAGARKKIEAAGGSVETIV